MIQTDIRPTVDQLCGALVSGALLVEAPLVDVLVDEV